MDAAEYPGRTRPPTVSSPIRPASRFPFTAYPAGWYRVAACRDLKPGQVLPLRCFGRDLILFRADNASPAILDAHCPHLGTHIGHGGRVIDGTVVCPFHGWRFRPDGQCASVPNVATPPARARLRAWPVQEANGAIMVWFDGAGGPPLWDALILSEWDSPAWTAFRPTRTRVVRTHVQELAENGIDMAHFTAIHGGQIAMAESDGLTIDGPTLSHRIRNGFNSRIARLIRLFGLSPATDAYLPGALEFTYRGLGTMVCRAEVAGRFPVAFLTVLYFLPADQDHVQVSGETTIRRHGILTPALRMVAAREAERAITDDTAILENKRYLEQPRLTVADGPIMQFRNWARQFHG